MQKEISISGKIKRGAVGLLVALCWGVGSPSLCQAGAGGAALSGDEFGQLVANLDPKSRQALFESEESFLKYLRQEATRKAVLQAIKASGFAEEARNKYLLARKGEELLLNLYLAQQVEGKLDKNYPPAEEVKAYYERNKEKLQLEERVALAQIFLAVPEKASAEEEKATAKKAKELAEEVRKGTMTFAAAAGKNSDHLPSRLNGGFMGVVKVSELIPEVKNEILALAPGTIGAPVRSKSGWHIFKLSEKLAPQSLSLAEAEQGIRQLLIKGEQETLSQKAIEALLGGKELPFDEAAGKKIYSEMKEKTK